MKNSLPLFLALLLATPLAVALEEPGEPVDVNVVNTPTVKHEAIGANDLRSEAFSLKATPDTPAEMKVAFAR